MAGRTGIEWTDATWNPTTGCTKISAGCEHCYAETLARRLLRDRYCMQPPVADTPENRADPFAVRLWPERLNEPRLWRSPRHVFVDSMSDLFHQAVPEHFVRKVFRIMLEADHHIYQVLTKRPGRAGRFIEGNLDLFPGPSVPEHVWLGTSVESQEVAYRVRQLREIPASVRFVSCEPLLGPTRLRLDGIHWIIVGGESGPERRPMDLAWARGLRDQCLAADVPFFFKQVGGRTPRAGGRLLDGRTWDETPAGL